jgi:hypothetical protein
LRGGSDQGGTGVALGGSGAAPSSGGTGGAIQPVGGTSATTGGTGTGAFAGTDGRGGSALAGSGPTEPPGPVLCGGVECSESQACCQTNAVCYDPELEGDLCPRPDPFPDIPDWRPCASSAHCEPGEYCASFPGDLCQGPGYCQSRSSCGGSSYAVCGCDGNSYSHIGEACRAGANHQTTYVGGGCGETIDANSFHGVSLPRWVTLCGSQTHCAAGERCCNLTGICYPESDPGRCQTPPEGTRYPCTADDQCVAGYEFCAGLGCSGPGGCVSIHENEDCGVRFEPVCGCNGVSYTSAPCAYAEGVRVASEGACPTQ